MPNRFFYFTGILFSFLILAVFVLVFFNKTNETVVYVNNLELFDGFQMTKEMKKEGEAILNKEKKDLESMQVNFSISTTGTEKQELLRKIIEKKQQIDNFQRAYIHNNSEKIWNRIHQYSKDFARERGYDLVIGSQFKSDVIYSEEKLDVTKEMLNFINSKYEGL